LDVNQIFFLISHADFFVIILHYMCLGNLDTEITL
jgi:hypothetical protein